MALQWQTIKSDQTIPRVLASSLSKNLNWTYSASDARDRRLDLLRGFAVFMMVVDHLGGNSWLYLITGGNSFFTSGAEAFVFISGLLVGTVGKSTALKHGLRSAQAKFIKRALMLYKVTVVLTFIFAVFSRFFNLPWSSDLPGNWLTFAINVLLMRQTMYLADIPLLNTLLMLLVPLGLWLLYTKRTTWLLLGSGVLWAAFQVFPGQVQIPWPILGNTTFNLAAWQLIYFCGMAFGYHREMLTEKLSLIPRWPYFLLLGTMLLYLVQLHSTNGAWLSGMFPDMYPQELMADLFKKSALAPGRLVASLIVFQFAYLGVTLLWKPICILFGWILLPLGQHSLYCYSIHVAVMGVFYAVLNYLPWNVSKIDTVNTGIQLLVVLLIWAMARREFLFRVVPR